MIMNPPYPHVRIIGLISDSEICDNRSSDCWFSRGSDRIQQPYKEGIAPTTALMH